MSAAVTAAGGGASKEEVPRHRVASLSDVNKAVVLPIKPKLWDNAAELSRSNRASALCALHAGLSRAVALGASGIEHKRSSDVSPPMLLPARPLIARVAGSIRPHGEHVT